MLTLSMTFEGYFSYKPPQNQYIRNTQHILHKNKSSAVAEMGDCRHNRHGPKRGEGSTPLSWGIEDNVASAEVYFHTKWHLHASSRLPTTDRPKTRGPGGCAPFLEGAAGTPSNTS